MRSLENQGVNVLFGYPGGAIMPTYDALYDHKDKLHHIQEFFHLLFSKQLN